MIAVTRLLTLLALLAMPFGMAGAGAQAAPGMDHPAAQMAPGHCPDQAPDDGAEPAFAGCAMPCASALPAALSQPGLARSSPAPGEPMVQSTPSGIFLEIATPPPRAA